MTPPYSLVKRGFESLFAATAVLIMGPFTLLAALAIWLEDRSASPFLKQERIGMGERTFQLFKLRTMRLERYRDGRKLTDAERLLATGRLFRKLSIDELPQLVNVLRGEMSLIGPRPMPVTYLPYFRVEERVRHAVRPGMSGLAQVSGRNFLSWDEKFALDVRYVQNMSLTLDLKIFLLTLLKVLVPSGVGVGGEDLRTVSLHEEREPWPSDFTSHHK
jgi:undecaprenyl phosphate N,N'-diacetylbacillosamine 1-phosphate transferase